jgi:type I restriction enzyme, S subunit
LIKYNKIQEVSKQTKLSTNIATENDILITVKVSGVGELWYLSLPAVVIGRQLMAARTSNGSSGFIFQFLLTKRTRFEDLASGNLIPGLSRGDILDLEARFPSILEQQKIASCLASLDDLITAQTQKLAGLQTHKKGLMQQLFPLPSEVAG